MKPIKFKEQTESDANMNYSNYPKCPVKKYEDGMCVSCWKLSFIERIRILINGKIWLSLLSFNKVLNPSFLTTKKTEVIGDYELY